MTNFGSAIQMSQLARINQSFESVVSLEEVAVELRAAHRPSNGHTEKATDRSIHRDNETLRRRPVKRKRKR